MAKTGLLFLLAALTLLCLAPLSANPVEEGGDYDDNRYEATPDEVSDEFLDQIKPGATIYLEPDYDYPLVMSDELEDLSSRYYYFEEVFNGVQLVIHDVRDLTIVGNPQYLSPLFCAHNYAYVILFRNCDGITLSYLNCGHLIEGYCEGGVLGFENCKNVEIDNCDLWGCGTEGITIRDTKNFTCSNTTIRDCSYSIMSVYDSRNVKFEYCRMYNNREFSLINLFDSNQVRFDNCVIWDNYAPDSALIYTSECYPVFSECAIFNNSVNSLLNSPEDATFEHCTLIKNEYLYYD